MICWRLWLYSVVMSDTLTLISKVRYNFLIQGPIWARAPHPAWDNAQELLQSGSFVYLARRKCFLQGIEFSWSLFSERSPPVDAALQEETSARRGEGDHFPAH